MNPVQKMRRKRANKSTSGFAQPATPRVATRGKKVKTYGQVPRLRKRRSKNNPSSEMTFELRSRKVVTPTPPQFMEPIPRPPTLKRYDEESLVGGVVHTVPQPGPSFRPAENYNNIDIIVDQEQDEDEYESSPIIANVRSLLHVIDLTKDDDHDDYDDEEEEDKTERSEEKSNAFVEDVKPEVYTAPYKKAIVRRRPRKPVKDISSDIVRKAIELQSKKEFLQKGLREFLAMKNNSEAWHRIAMEMPNCWILLETLFDIKH